MEDIGGLTFDDEVHEVPIEKIRANPANPRHRYLESEEDELLTSMDSKGIINPVIAFRKGDLYYLVDGERRFEAAKKLKMKRIPARILDREPTQLENLSMMFHIHNVAEDWTDMAIALTIQKIKDIAGTTDIGQISKITSLSAYKVKKYLNILDFPKRILDRFLESEKKEEPDLDVDFLTEIHTPIQRMKRTMPELLRRYPVERFVSICIRKKRNGIIRTNKEFRDLGKIVLNVKKGKINREVAGERIGSFLENEEVTIEEIYAEMSEAIEQAKGMLKASIRLTEDIKNIAWAKVPVEEREELQRQLRILMDSIRVNIS